MKVSNCCGADGNVPLNKHTRWVTAEQGEICPKCGEHCDYIEETTFETINTENEQPIESRPGKGTATDSD